MDFHRKVVLVLILFSASIYLTQGIPSEYVESHSKFLKALIFSALQRPRRRAESDSTGQYDEDYDEVNPPEWLTTWMDELGATVGHWGRHPPPLRKFYNRRTGYKQQTDYDYEGSDRNFGGSGGRYGSSYGSRPGYQTRRRYANRWFDNRDDYADEILAYRFYNGGYRPSGQRGNNQRRRGYQQGGRQGGGRRGDWSTMFDFQGARPVKDGYGGIESSGFGVDESEV